MIETNLKENGHKCFFCDKPIVGNGVAWDEAVYRAEETLTIRLHPICSTMLAERLLRDGLKAMTPKDRKIHKEFVEHNIKYALT